MRLFIKIVFLLYTIIAYNIDEDESLLSIYTNEYGINIYECPKGYGRDNINTTKCYKCSDKNETLENGLCKKKDSFLKNSDQNDNYYYSKCENYCINGKCMIIFDYPNPSFPWCDCYRGYFGKYCQNSAQNTVKMNLNNIFGIDAGTKKIIKNFDNFFSLNASPSSILETYQAISEFKSIIDFFDNPFETLVKNSFSKILSGTVGAIIEKTPLSNFNGINNFFGIIIDIGIDLLFRRLRNLDETKLKLSSDLNNYAEINKKRGINVIKEGYYIKKVERDYLNRILYISEKIKRNNISFYGWSEDYNKKCRNLDIWNNYNDFVMVITEIMDVEKRKYFEEPCMKKIYTLKDNINVEEICMKKLQINKKINDNTCYYNKKSKKSENSNFFLRVTFWNYFLFLIFVFKF